MNTTIYLIRHSIPLKEHIGIKLITDDILSWNMKTPLSVEGELLAQEYFKQEQFKNIDAIWSSAYVRAMSTAKYLAYYNDLKVNVASNFNERIHGIDSWSELPSDFEIRQFEDENYKIGYGESRHEVATRLKETIEQILKTYQGKNIAIIGHSTAFAFLLSNWCEINYTGPYSFKGKEIFDGKFNYLETFKLTFDGNNNLLDIENIKGISLPKPKHKLH